MPKIADWPPTRADSQHILSQHPDAPPEHLHTCKVCGDTYWGKPANNGRIRSFCSKRCYYKHQDCNPGFQRYRTSPKGKAMRQKVQTHYAQSEHGLLRYEQRQRWHKLVISLDPSQKPKTKKRQNRWPTCSTPGCHNIPSKKRARSCSACLWDARIANRSKTWRNFGKPCKGGCGKLLTRYQRNTCADSECVKIHQRNNTDFFAKRRIIKHRRRARKREAFVEDVDVMVHLEWQQGKCYHCGNIIRVDKKAPHPKSLTLDHLVPLALGGEHSYANTAASCWKCNCLVKGSRSMGEQLKLL